MTPRKKEMFQEAHDCYGPDAPRIDQKLILRLPLVCCPCNRRSSHPLVLLRILALVWRKLDGVIRNEVPWTVHRAVKSKNLVTLSSNFGPLKTPAHLVHERESVA